MINPGSHTIRGYTCDMQVHLDGTKSYYFDSKNGGGKRGEFSSLSDLEAAIQNEIAQIELELRNKFARLNTEESNVEP